MGASTGATVRSRVFLTAIVVGAFFVVAIGGGFGPAYAEHCHPGDADLKYETASDCHDEEEYDDNENYKCSDTEKLNDGDLDGDGTDDCDDPDDDGDHLSDKLERVYTPGDYRDKYSDDSFPDDGADIVPQKEGGAFVTITAASYTPPTDDCGDGIDLADPYIPSGELEVSYGKSDIDLPSPEGWEEDYTNDVAGDGDDNDDAQDGGTFEDGHLHERALNEVGDLILDDGDDSTGNGDVTDNDFDIPDDINAYPGDTANGIPRIVLQIGLKDHDLEYPDRMDISDVGGTIAQFGYPLTIDDGSSRDRMGDGDGSCDAGIGFDFDDTADKDAVRAAVYHRDNPGDDVVQTSDIT